MFRPQLRLLSSLLLFSLKIPFIDLLLPSRPLFRNPHRVHAALDIVIIPQIPGAFPARPDFVSVAAIAVGLALANKTFFEVGKHSRTDVGCEGGGDGRFWDVDDWETPPFLAYDF
jgi:hypothetical protein